MLFHYARGILRQVPCALSILLYEAIHSPVIQVATFIYALRVEVDSDLPAKRRYATFAASFCADHGNCKFG